MLRYASSVCPAHSYRVSVVVHWRKSPPIAPGIECKIKLEAEAGRGHAVGEMERFGRDSPPISANIRQPKNMAGPITVTPNRRAACSGGARPRIKCSSFQLPQRPLPSTRLPYIGFSSLTIRYPATNSDDLIQFCKYTDARLELAEHILATPSVAYS